MSFNKKKKKTFLKTSINESVLFLKFKETENLLKKYNLRKKIIALFSMNFLYKWIHASFFDGVSWGSKYMCQNFK